MSKDKTLAERTAKERTESEDTGWNVPFVAFEADELGGPAAPGDVIDCDICGGSHALVGIPAAAGAPSSMLLTYACGEESYLAAIDGRYVIDRFKAERRRLKEGGR